MRRTAFIGGSNIGDHYPHWRDSNLRLDGNLGDTFRPALRLHWPIFQKQNFANQASCPCLNCVTNGASLMLTLPGHRQDIRRALLDLILNAEKSITIRTWYFLPDKEILNALLSQAENGVRVNVIFSHRTRVPFIDAANRFIANKLVKSGVRVYRYKGQYMHGKEAWNDKSDILFGSANVDWWALYSNFECDLQLRSPVSGPGSCNRHLLPTWPAVNNT